MALSKKLTIKYLTSITPSGEEYFVKDTSLQGFGIRVSRKGKVSFIAEGKIKGSRKMRRITIGSFPAFSIDDAKEIASGHLRLMSQGVDPVEKRKEDSKAKTKSEALKKSLDVTLEDILKKFYQSRELKPKTKYDYENTIKNHLADWLDLPVRDITRQMIENKFFEIIKNAGRSNKESGKATATKTMRILSTVLNYAKAEEIEGERLITDNPCEVLSDKRIDRRIPRKTNYLKPEEVPKLMDALDEPPDGSGITICSKSFAEAIKLILLTGLRKNEAFKLRWEDVHLDNKIPYFVVKDTKNSTAHYVPLTKTTLLMFKNLSRSRSKSSPWVFPSTKNSSKPISEPRAVLKKLSKEIGKEFTLHDLRRTFTTIAADIGLDYLAIKRLLNHSIQDITERYVVNQNTEKLKRVKGYLEQIEAGITQYTLEHLPPILDEILNKGKETQ